MSKKEQNVTEKPEKVLTKYDLKMQRREEEKKRAKREKLIGNITGVVIVAAVFCLVASFPIRTYLTLNGTYIKVGNESVNKVEFDYQYNLTKNNYISQNGYYLSMFGLDLSGDISGQMYSDTLTWQDYFEQLTVESIAKNKALRDQAGEAGFTYDTADDYQKFLDSVKEGAKEAGITEKEFVRQCYGELATIDRIRDYVKDDLFVSAFYQKVAEEKLPTEEEINTYYDKNPDQYDSVDYILSTVSAVLPTEPTELADPVEEGSETGEDEAYTPSQAEIDKAMEDAFYEAQTVLEKIDTEGELKENMKYSSMITVVRDWAFDGDRKAGDTACLENTTGRCYYVVKFVKRYRDETTTRDARIVLTADGNAQAILDEWKSGEATEATFAEIADKYNDSAITSAEGGLYEGLLASGVPTGMDTWLFEEGRKAGDTTVIPPATEEDEMSYVVYFVGEGDPEWKISIRDTLQSEALTEYLSEISKAYEVSDSKGNLKYLEIQASESAAKEASESAAAESEESSAE